MCDSLHTDWSRNRTHVCIESVTRRNRANKEGITVDDFILDQAGFEVRDWEQFWEAQELSPEEELQFD